VPKTEEDKKSASKIIDNVKTLLEQKTLDNTNSENIQKIIDTSVYDLFKISEEHRKHIKKKLIIL